MGVIRRWGWLSVAVLSIGCNAILGIDPPHTIAADAAIAFDAKPVVYDAPPDATVMFDAPAPDAPRPDASGPTFDAAPDAAPPVDAARDAKTFDAP